jgi:hypothetical protein
VLSFLLVLILSAILIKPLLFAYRFGSFSSPTNSSNYRSFENTYAVIVCCFESKMMRGFLQISRRNRIQRRHFSQASEPPKTNLRGPVTFGGLAVLALGGIAAWFWHYVEKEEKIKKVSSKVTVTGKPALGGPWVLVDQDGVPRSDASYHGKFSLLYFGFTHCPDICPSELVKIGKIINELGKVHHIFYH